MINYITKQSLIKHLCGITHSYQVLSYIYNYCKTNNIECYKIGQTKFLLNIDMLSEEQTNELFMLLFSRPH